MIQQSAHLMEAGDSDHRNLAGFAGSEEAVHLLEEIAVGTGHPRSGTSVTWVASG